MQTIPRTVVIAAVLALTVLSDSAFAGSATAPTTKAAPTTAAAATVHQRLSGTIVTIDPTARVVKLRIGKPGTEETFHLTPSATVTKGGKEISLGLLKIGERVTATKDGDQLASLAVRGK